VAAADERRHRRGPQPWWGESWSFDLAAADASVGGFVRLGWYPKLGVAWYWAALVGRDRRLVLVRDHDIEIPRGEALEIRGQGLWSAVTCETPLDHWSVGLEAFGVALDDPIEAFGGERGDLVGLGFDLEWEATGPAWAPGPDGYDQACRVSGEILVGDERLEFAGRGHRGHAWGVQDWWAAPRSRASGVLDDGTAFMVQRGGGRSPVGHVTPGSPGSPFATDRVAIDAEVDGSGLPVSAAIAVGDLSLAALVVAPAPLRLPAPDGRGDARLARALCRYRSGDGRPGAGWAEWLTPAPGPGPGG
jgi:hypothetical protein